MSSNLSLQDIGRMFDERVRKYGDSPEASEHLGLQSQEKRMRLLAEVGIPAEASILDLGCGTGHFLEFLRREFGFRGRYTGYDLSAEMVQLSRSKYPDARIEQRNILTHPPEETFDFAFICGTFNDRFDSNEATLHAVLRALKPHIREAICFNLLSCYVDYFDCHLYYVDPGAIFRFCKEEITPRVALRHDYETKPGVVPYEFTVYAFMSGIPCRRLQSWS